MYFTDYEGYLESIRDRESGLSWGLTGGGGAVDGTIVEIRGQKRKFLDMEMEEDVELLIIPSAGVVDARFGKVLTSTVLKNKYAMCQPFIIILAERQPLWPQSIYDVIDDPLWNPQYQWNLTPPNPKSEKPQGLTPPSPGSDGEAILNELIRHLGYTGPREDFEDSLLFRRFRNQNTHPTLGHHATVPTAHVVKSGNRKLELYFNKNSMRYRGGKNPRQNPTKCCWKECWTMLEGGHLTCPYHNMNQFNHTAILWNQPGAIFAVAFYDGGYEQEAIPPFNKNWVHPTTRFSNLVQSERLDLNLDFRPVVRRWKEVVNGTADPTLRHSIKVEHSAVKMK